MWAETFLLFANPSNFYMYKRIYICKYPRCWTSHLVKFKNPWEDSTNIYGQKPYRGLYLTRLHIIIVHWKDIIQVCIHLEEITHIGPYGKHKDLSLTKNRNITNYLSNDHRASCDIRLTVWKQYDGVHVWGDLNIHPNLPIYNKFYDQYLCYLPIFNKILKEIKRPFIFIEIGIKLGILIFTLNVIYRSVIYTYLA